MNRFRDYLYIGLLALYVLAGCALVPLHGDEPTVIYTSWDVDAIRRGDWAHLVYQDPPPTDDPQSTTRQDLRLINGVLSRYWYGLLWNVAGMTPRDLNDQWLWGADLTFNRANGHVPSDQLLFLVRFGAGLLTALSVAVIFNIGKKAGGRGTAYLATAIYTFTPALLLNGRRATMESGFLLCSALLVYAGQRFAEKQDARRLLWLGVAAGLTLASKHTGLLTIAAIFGGIGLYRLVRNGVFGALRTGAMLIGTTVIMIVVFILFNPLWWNPSEVIKMPGRILAARQALLEGQTQMFGGYANTSERTSGLIRELFIAPPQYYEVKEGWPVWIGDQIKAYESTPFVGMLNPIFSSLAAILFLIGLWKALQCWRNPSIFVLLIFAILSIAGIFIATPVGWQRYYLPLIAPVALLCGQSISTRRI